MKWLLAAVLCATLSGCLTINPTYKIRYVINCSNCHYYYTIEGSLTVSVQKSERRINYSTETFEHKGDGFVNISVQNNLNKADTITAVIYIDDVKQIELTDLVAPNNLLTIQTDTRLKK